MQCNECERLQDRELKTMLDYARAEPSTGRQKRNRLKLWERRLRAAEKASLRHQSEHLRTRKAA